MKKIIVFFGLALALVSVDSQARWHNHGGRHGSASTASTSGGTGQTAGPYHRGPRGGCYTVSASGRKRYVDRSLCQ